MNVEILTTPDCSNCSVVEKMLDEMGVSYNVIDVTEKIFTAPGIVINGSLEFVGVPKKKDLEIKLTDAS